MADTAVKKQTRLWTDRDFDLWIDTLTISDRARSFLYALKTHLNYSNKAKVGSCYLYKSTLAKALGKSTKTIQRIIAELRKAGILDVKYRSVEKCRNLSNIFTLSTFLKWLKIGTPGGQKCPPVGGDSVPQKPKDIKRSCTGTDSNILKERNWEVPKTGSVKGTAVGDIIRKHLPEHHSIDWVMSCFREKVAKDDNPVTTERLIGFCKTIIGKDRKKSKAVVSRPIPARPTPTHTPWDKVIHRIYKKCPYEYQNWFSNISFSTDARDTPVLTFETAYEVTYVKAHYNEMILRIFSETPIYQLKVQNI